MQADHDGWREMRTGNRGFYSIASKRVSSGASAGSGREPFPQLPYLQRFSVLTGSAAETYTSRGKTMLGRSCRDGRLCGPRDAACRSRHGGRAARRAQPGGQRPWTATAPLSPACRPGISRSARTARRREVLRAGRDTRPRQIALLVDTSEGRVRRRRQFPQRRRRVRRRAPPRERDFHHQLRRAAAHPRAVHARGGPPAGGCRGHLRLLADRVLSARRHVGDDPRASSGAARRGP